MKLFVYMMIIINGITVRLYTKYMNLLQSCDRQWSFLVNKKSNKYICGHLTQWHSPDFSRCKYLRT